jgi:hypothetical protein
MIIIITITIIIDINFNGYTFVFIIIILKLLDYLEFVNNFFNYILTNYYYIHFLI